MRSRDGTSSFPPSPQFPPKLGGTEGERRKGGEGGRGGKAARKDPRLARFEQLVGALRSEHKALLTYDSPAFVQAIEQLERAVTELQPDLTEPLNPREQALVFEARRLNRANGWLIESIPEAARELMCVLGARNGSVAVDTAA